MKLFNSARLTDRKKGLSQIEELKNADAKTLVIHYSCESFFNTHGRTPRVTSIAIKNRGNGTSIVFSIHLTAQVKKKSLVSIADADLDLIEKDMLKEYFDFVNHHKTHKWVHWNMRNASYGFEAISNRYKILGGNPKSIEDQFKYDLPEILGNIYTYHFEKHKKPTKGQLLNLTIRNGNTTRDALTGEDEALAFDQKDFLKLHMSTMRKVEMVDRILSLQEKRQLKVAVSIVKSCGLTPSGIIEIVRSHWLLFTIWSIVMAVLGMALEPVIQHVFGTDKLKP